MSGDDARAKKLSIFSPERRKQGRYFPHSGLVLLANPS
jgi:hypothetical protein